MQTIERQHCIPLSVYNGKAMHVGPGRFDHNHDFHNYDKICMDKKNINASEASIVQFEGPE